MTSNRSKTTIEQINTLYKSAHSSLCKLNIYVFLLKLQKLFSQELWHTNDKFWTIVQNLYRLINFYRLIVSTSTWPTPIKKSHLLDDTTVTADVHITARLHYNCKYIFFCCLQTEGWVNIYYGNLDARDDVDTHTL